MATTYKSDYITNGYPVPTPMNGAVASVTARYTQAAAYVINDVIQMVAIPNGYQVTEVILDADQLDTNGSPLITLSVGDATTVAAYITASTIGQTGGIARASTKAYMDNTPVAIATSGGNPGTTIVQVKVIAAPATGTTTAKIRLTVFYAQASGVAAAAFS